VAPASGWCGSQALMNTPLRRASNVRTAGRLRRHPSSPLLSRLERSVAPSLGLTHKRRPARVGQGEPRYRVLLDPRDGSARRAGRSSRRAACVEPRRRSRPRSRRTVGSASLRQMCPSAHDCPQLPQIWRRGQCLTVRGPWNSQSGRCGMTNMAARAARPIQGVSTSAMALIPP